VFDNKTFARPNETAELTDIRRRLRAIRVDANIRKWSQWGGETLTIQCSVSAGWLLLANA